MLVVITGSIWAKASWGTWWVWSDPRLVTFLIVLLLYAAYFVLRSSAEGERRMRYSAIYSMAGLRLGAAVVLLGAGGPLVRAPRRLHPAAGPTCPGTMLIWFVVSQLAVIGVFLTILQLELIQRRADRALRRVKRRLEAERHEHRRPVRGRGLRRSSCSPS